jgi:hypothetical protein
MTLHPKGHCLHEFFNQRVFLSRPIEGEYTLTLATFGYTWMDLHLMEPNGFVSYNIERTAMISHLKVQMPLEKYLSRRLLYNFEFDLVHIFGYDCFVCEIYEWTTTQGFEKIPAVPKSVQ